MGLDDVAVKPHERLAGFLAEDLAAVNALIRERMASEHAPRIPEVTAHLVEAGGKRLRPMLTLAAARMCGYDGPFHVHLAATVEFIHTATLLHDDVVDESRKRRGRPTANLLWDNKSSVLVGDYLFARSFQLDGRNRIVAGAGHSGQCLGHDCRRRGVAADGGAGSGDGRSDLSQDRARQDGGAVFGGDRSGRRDCRGTGSAGRRAAHVWRCVGREFPDCR